MPTLQQATAWAEDLCSRAEYSSGEIRRRLIAKGISPDEADTVVAALIERRFIDNARFARAFVREKLSFARWGRHKIAAALASKGVGRDIIREALDEIDPDEYQTVLQDLLKAKLRSLRAEPTQIDWSMRTKIYRFAASRGFESSAISSALTTLKR